MDKTSLIQDRLIYESRMRSSAHWLYWIAGLSLINTVILFTGGNINFIFGLGITQLIDSFAYYMLESIGDIVTYIAVAIDVFIACIFILLGRYAAKRMKWAFISGIILYTLDGILFILLGDYLSVAFHGWVIYSLYTGISAMQCLIETERQMKELWEQEEQRQNINNVNYSITENNEQENQEQISENNEEKREEDK